MPHRVRAQSIEQVATMPPNVVLGNYDSVPVGPSGGLEGGAYVARVSDPSAAWFNPAGLSQVRAQISASAGVYKWIAVSPEHLPHSTAEDQYRTSRTSSAAPSTFAARSTGGRCSSPRMPGCRKSVRNCSHRFRTGLSGTAIPQIRCLCGGLSPLRRVSHRQRVACGCRLVTVHDGTQTRAGHQRPSRRQLRCADIARDRPNSGHSRTVSRAGWGSVPMRRSFASVRPSGLRDSHFIARGPLHSTAWSMVERPLWVRRCSTRMPASSSAFPGSCRLGGGRCRARGSRVNVRAYTPVSPSRSWRPRADADLRR